MIEKAYRTVWGIHNDWVAESVSGSRQNDSAFASSLIHCSRPKHGILAPGGGTPSRPPPLNSAPGEISMRNCLKLLPSLRLLVPMATIGLIVASSTAFAAQEVKMVEHASTITH